MGKLKEFYDLKTQEAKLVLQPEVLPALIDDEFLAKMKEFSLVKETHENPKLIYIGNNDFFRVVVKDIGLQEAYLLEIKFHDEDLECYTTQIRFDRLITGCLDDEILYLKNRIKNISPKSYLVLTDPDDRGKFNTLVELFEFVEQQL